MLCLQQVRDGWAVFFFFVVVVFFVLFFVNHLVGRSLSRNSVNG